MSNPFLKDSIQFFECMQMDSSVQYPFNAHSYQTSNRLIAKTISNIFSHPCYICTQHWYEMNGRILCAHVSIEIKPFDFFCVRHSFSFPSIRFVLNVECYCSQSVLSFNLPLIRFFSLYFPFIRSLSLFLSSSLLFEYHYEPLHCQFSTSFHHAFCIKII